MDKLKELRRRIEESKKESIKVLSPNSPYSYKEGCIDTLDSVLTTIDRIINEQNYAVINGKKYKLTEVEE